MGSTPGDTGDGSERANPISDAMPAPSSEETTAAPLQFASPPTPSRDLEVVLDKYRGFRRPLRYLAINTAVARPADDGLHPVQLRPICLCHPTGDTRSSFSAPFHLSLSDRGAALQPPVEDQQSLRGRNYFILNLPRLHGARSPCSGSVTRPSSKEIRRWLEMATRWV